MTHSKQVSARGLLILFVSALCVTADQSSKHWALANLTHGQPQPFLPGFIRFMLTANPGAAFSLGNQNGQLMGIVATVLSIAILSWIIKRIVSTEPLPVVEQIGMGCLFGGAVGNLIDRYTRGQVTDFLEFAFVSFPVFNVADALIDVGIGCLFIAMYLIKRDEQKEHGSTDKPSSKDSGKENVSAETGAASSDRNEVLNFEPADKTDGDNENSKTKRAKDGTSSNISSSTGGTTN